MGKMELGDAGPGLVLVVDDERQGLGCAFDAGATIAESRNVDRMTLWSCRTFLDLNDIRMVDASWRECHRWTLPREAFANGNPPGTSWAGEPLDESQARECASKLNSPARVDKRFMAGCDGDVVVFDFQCNLDLDDLCRLNTIAKECGKTAVVCSELRDAQNRPYPLDSYAELALRICVERGVNLAECATQIVVRGRALV